MLGILNFDFNCERIMCSCLAPQEFLDHLEEFKNIPHIPTELRDIILSHTRSFTKCRFCKRIVAKSINSYCRIHCAPYLTCIDCSKKKQRH